MHGGIRYIQWGPGFQKQPTGRSDQIGFLPASSNVLAIRVAINRRRPPVQASDNSKTRLRFALWHYPRDHGEDMKKWHKKPTSALQARVKELEDRSTTKVNFSKKVVVPVIAGHGNSQEDNGGNK